MDESAIVKYAACGNLDEVKALLQSDDPVLTSELINRVDKDGKSAFHYACLNDDTNMLTILLRDPRVDVNLTSKVGNTAYHMAAYNASMKAITLLKNDGRVDINLQNKFGETPLHLCAGSGDNHACKTAELLLSFGALLSVTDKWHRGPLDVSIDNAENSLMKTFKEYLNDPSRCNEEERLRVEAISTKYKTDREKEEESSKSAYDAKSKLVGKLLFGTNFGAAGAGIGGDGCGCDGLAGLLGGVKLKKTSTVLKTMFSAGEGKTTNITNTSNIGSINSVAQLQQQGIASASGDSRRALSKLIEFPGDLEELQKMLEQADVIDPAAKDSYGLTALHKFASWNKTEYIDLLVPCLKKEDLEIRCPEGKTALHYAVEVASVAAVKRLVIAGADLDAVDGKGRTVTSIIESAATSRIIDSLKNALVKPEDK